MTRKERKMEAKKKRLSQIEEWNEELFKLKNQDKTQKEAIDILIESVTATLKSKPREKSEIILAWTEFMGMLLEATKQAILKISSTGESATKV